MTAKDMAAAVARTLEWEAARRRAALDVARARADTAERAAAERQAQQQAEEKPRPDPDVLAFARRMTGQPEPLDLLGTLAKHQAQAPAEDMFAFARDRGAEYGSAQNPGRYVGESFREAPPAAPVRRSAEPVNEWAVQRMLDQDRESHLWMARFKVRHYGRAAVEAARGTTVSRWLAAERPRGGVRQGNGHPLASGRL